MLSSASHPRLAVSALLLVSLAALAHAQSATESQGQPDPRATPILGGDHPKKEKTPTSRSVKGKVTDGTGKPIDNAVVTLVNQDTHTSLTFFTKQGGQYYFDDLSFTTDYKLSAQYKEAKSPVRTLSQYDRAPNIVRMLEVEPPAGPPKPEETAQKKP